MNDTRQSLIAIWERDGLMEPDCPGCAEFYGSPLMPYEVFAPRHRGSVYCESGGRPHCTCELCF